MAHRTNCKCEDCVHPYRPATWEVAIWSFFIGFAVCGFIWKLCLGIPW